MTHRLYDELTPWYRLIDPAEDHRDECAAYEAALVGAVPGAETLLELGAGAGNNASHLSRRFRCTLADVSAPMQALSRALVPHCEHVLGDMRTLRLGRTFDCVFVHDAIVYMLTEDDLRAAIETAFVHTRPGGAALFAPDFVRETFSERAELHQHDEGARSLRCLDWTWDPDPTDHLYRGDYAFLLRDGTDLRAVHDTHLEACFPRETWMRLLRAAGFTPELVDRPFDDTTTDQIFLARRR